ncbi:magnesium transporter [Flavobacterium fryxellicola]|uniref:Magnesium transport protein CorA n=1 Tax=Flavobacterium fryxellicola TaxID=249352 RepID=A0A167YUE0_9FLAO|nr:magnesium/cobalt transporter CorA [Flavobacterium fryxellicola]OAB29799.1 magnesium and cobalt transport protein CorA [Flavobacterium fryxellicola]SHN73116.1 magnesium transporter [Flavobacterium fryxellicola]
MRKIKYKKGRKLQPYNLEYTGIHKTKDSEMQLFVYDDLDLSEYENFKVANLDKYIDDQKTNWINIHGLNNVEWLKSIGDYFKIDNFMLADIMNTVRRTKLEESHKFLFFNIKSILPAENSDNISVEQISFLIKEGVLISFQEKRSDFFTHIRERIRTHSGLVREKKADYLLYVLLDAIMENFYITLENEEDKLEELINLSKQSPDPVILERIEKHRDNFNFLKRSIIPLRESLYNIKSIKDDNVFNAIEVENFTFFSRLHQKSLELLEQIESDMGSLESASNFFFSAQTHKMNEIMKTLTIVSSIFIPLTFIVGVYGMNFENLPELQYKYGYQTVMGFMFLIVIGMIIYFKKRRWF